MDATPPPPARLVIEFGGRCRHGTVGGGAGACWEARLRSGTSATTTARRRPPSPTPARRSLQAGVGRGQWWPPARAPWPPQRRLAAIMPGTISAGDHCLGMALACPSLAPRCSSFLPSLPFPSPPPQRCARCLALGSRLPPPQSPCLPPPAPFRARGQRRGNNVPPVNLERGAPVGGDAPPRVAAAGAAGRSRQAVVVAAPRRRGPRSSHAPEGTPPHLPSAFPPPAPPPLSPFLPPSRRALPPRAWTGGHLQFFPVVVPPRPPAQDGLHEGALTPPGGRGQRTAEEVGCCRHQPAEGVAGGSG